MIIRSNQGQLQVIAQSPKVLFGKITCKSLQSFPFNVWFFLQKVHSYRLFEYAQTVFNHKRLYATSISVYFSIIYSMLNLPRLTKVFLSFMSFHEQSLKKTVFREKKLSLLFLKSVLSKFMISAIYIYEYKFFEKAKMNQLIKT